MCGLVGVMNFGGARFNVTPEYLQRMRDSIAHRGPDAEGWWISEDHQVGLAHRRLSIIDLSDSATQPMCSKDGRIQVVFNGEIYNHAEIRRELDADYDIKWRTDHSDTEVIIHAYRAWGMDCLHHFIGMFAIALYDADQDCMFLVRDRIGIKPLYWTTLNNRLAFASEIKALLTDPTLSREVDLAAMGEYLAFLCTPAPATLFKGINKLEPGHWLRIDRSGNLSDVRWYDVLTAAAEVHIHDAYAQVDETLKSAVALRKVGDVPMGVFLSGGIDSSANALLFGSESTEPIRTFSIGYGAEAKTYTDELPYARQMAQFVGADHHERVLTSDDLISFLPRMIELQDEPIADPVCVPVYYVAKLARQNGVTVCQVGEGADELFFGYPHWRYWLAAARFADTGPGRLAARVGRAGLRAINHTDHRLYDALMRTGQGQPMFWSSAQGPTRIGRTRIAGAAADVLKQDCGWATIETQWHRFKRDAADPHLLNWMTFADLSLRLPELLLMRVDKMTMGTSLEARVPFLDHRLVELAMAIPTGVRTQGSRSKPILKGLFRNKLPDGIIDRPKRGFGVPLNDWLAGRLGETIERELKRFCVDTGFFDIRGVTDMMQGSSPFRSWYLFNFALWHRHFIEGEDITSLLSA